MTGSRAGSVGRVGLSKFTALIGASGSGKSRALESVFRDLSARWATHIYVDTDPSVFPVGVVLENIKAAYPDISGIRVNPCSQRLYEIQVGDDWLPANGIGRGRRKLIDLAMVASCASPHSTVLIDDVDLHVDPRCHAALAKMLASMAGQVVVSTHSPFFLDAVPEDSVRVLAETPTSIRSALLSDHPEWYRWKTVLKPGEFWSFKGDLWPLELPLEGKP